MHLLIRLYFYRGAFKGRLLAIDSIIREQSTLKKGNRIYFYAAKTLYKYVYNFTTSDTKIGDLMPSAMISIRLTH